VRCEWSIRHQTPRYNLFIDKKESVMWCERSIRHQKHF